MLEIPNCRPIIPIIDDIQLSVPANDGNTDYGIINPTRQALEFEFEMILMNVIQLPWTPLSPELLEIYKDGVRIINTSNDFGATYSKYEVVGSTITFGESILGLVKFVCDNAIEPLTPPEYIISVDNIQGGDETADEPNETWAATWCEPVVCTQPYHGYVRLSDDRTRMIYVPNLNYVGADSFSYTVMTQRGQLADPKCVYIDVVESQPEPLPDE